MQRERFKTLDLCLNRQRIRLPPELRALIKQFARNKKLTNETLREAVLLYFDHPSTHNVWCPRRDEVLAEYGDVSEWNTSDVTDMSGLFHGREKFKEYLNDWDTGNVVTMKRMFAGCTFFNLPLGKWNVSKVRDMSEMFVQCTWFNQPLNTWDTGSLVDASNMFFYAKAFNQPLDRWNTSQLQVAYHMFCGAYAFNQSLYAWDKSSIVNARYMFEESGMPAKYVRQFQTQYQDARDARIPWADPGVVQRYVAYSGTRQFFRLSEEEPDEEEEQYH